MLLISSIFTDIFANPGVLFVHNGIEGFDVVNVGEMLSEELQQCDLKSSVLPMVANDVLREILDDSVVVEKSGIKYLVLENLSILFEPELALDVEALFRSYARNIVLVIVDKHPIVNGCYWPFGTDSDISVDLSEIRYAEIF